MSSRNRAVGDTGGVVIDEYVRGASGLGAYGLAEHGQTEATVGGMPPMSREMKVSEFIRHCKQKFFFEFSWRVPFPRIPDEPLLYHPDVINEILRDPSPLGIMDAELDAMAIGVLDSIPLAYHLLHPGAVDEARQLSLDHERRLAELRQKNLAAGYADQVMWNPMDANPNLEAADAELLDTDIDLNMVLERDKPSLTLLQRPLYTDMGLVSQEQRHLERLSRIVPEGLRDIFSLPSPLESQLQSGSRSASVGLEIGTSRESAQTTNDQWREGIKKSFRVARAVDTCFDNMIEVLTRTKLGLNSKDPTALALTRRLWSLLFGGTTVEQQTKMWSKICHFSSMYNGRQSSTDELKDIVEALQLPHQESWLFFIRDYEKLLREYTKALPGGTSEREEYLKISESDINPPNQGGFKPDLQVGTLLRQQRRDVGPNHQPVPIFPVDVLPLYPAEFDEYAEAENEAGSRGNIEMRLGEMATTLHHLVLPGAVVGEGCRVGGPHVLVGKTNLLVADKGSDTRPSSGATVSYHTSRENTFEPLVTDGGNTSSYLFQVRSVSPMRGADFPGPANAAGHYVVYRRLAVRDLFVKAPNAEAPPNERYVVAFGANNEMRGVSRKRQRESLFGDSLIDDLFD
uniref:Uncharacterized protein n=1 Tax=Trypanosoma congolense (strain IL3000) TaxID=1068625 RepID=G0UKG8_TRYCI|nr:conserved hypothetical protein [Trypanosoma congolense IL3000]